MLAVEVVFSHLVISIIILVELFPMAYMIKSAALILWNFALKILTMKMDKMLNRCAIDKDYQNDIASYIYFFTDMGPNISSFSVIAVFITSNENWIVLTIVFYVGIMMKQKSRIIKKWFYTEIQKRS